MLYPFFAPQGPVSDETGAAEITALADVLFTGVSAPTTAAP